MAASSRSTRAREHVLDQRLLEGLHVEEAALGDRVGDLLGPLLADQVGDARVHHHHLDGGDAAAADARQQPLADHAAEHAGEHRADLLLLGGREELDHAADGLGGVDRVQGREDEVARLGGLERGLRRLGVAQLADQDRVRVLAQHAPERLGEALRVEPDLALVDDAVAVGMEDLDRILDRDDVLVPRPVDVVEHRRERRRLARAGGAGDEHEAAVLAGEAADAGRQAQLLEARHVARDDAEGERDGAALAEGVDAEARQALGRVGEVEVAALVERPQPLRRDAGDRLERGEQVLLVRAAGTRRAARSRRPTQHRRLVHLQVDVARAELDGAAEEGIQVHRASREESAGSVLGFRAVRSRRSGGRARPRASLG